MITLSENLALPQFFDTLAICVKEYCGLVKGLSSPLSRFTSRENAKEAFSHLITVKENGLTALPSGISLTVAFFNVLAYFERVGQLNQGNFEKICNHPNFEGLYYAVSRQHLGLARQYEEGNEYYMVTAYPPQTQEQVDTMMQAAETLSPPPSKTASTLPLQKQASNTQSAELPPTQGQATEDTNHQPLINQLTKYCTSSGWKHHQAEVRRILKTNSTHADKINQIMQIERSPTGSLSTILNSHSRADTASAHKPAALELQLPNNQAEHPK